jgi:GNAT superfamily N-acetyltransferase
MADLYLKPSDIIDTGYNPEGQQAQQGVNKDVEDYLNSLPLEERDAARQRLFAPPTGEELAMKVGQDRTYVPTLQEYEQIEKWHKTKEVELFDGLGTAAETVFNEFAAAAGSIADDPLKAAQQMPASVVEAFMQGTRAMYGMAAQSQNPDSPFFRVKDFISGTGTLESRYNQYLDALEFNRKSMDLMEGKETLVMDKDLINPEVTQAMSYIADPTLLIPFGKAASIGMRAVGMGEKLTVAASRAAAIKNGIIGNTIKWGAGQPLEFLGGAVRSTIDYGLEKAGDVFETATGMGAREFAQTARMSGIGVSTAGIAGHAIPYATAVSDAYFAGSAARGFGEALTAIGDTMKRSPFERGINSWAKEALEKTPNLSPQAQKLLKVLDAVDPMFAYSYAVAEGAAQGAVIGGGLGYLSGGEEGLYQGMGAGLALGTMGAGAGRLVAGMTGGIDVQRRAVQAKMVIEGLKEKGETHTAEALQGIIKAAEIRGNDVDLVNGIVSAWDKVAPHIEIHALTEGELFLKSVELGYDPATRKFAETTRNLGELGNDREAKRKVLSILSGLGGVFSGNRKGFLAELTRRKQYTKQEYDKLVADNVLLGRANMILGRFGYGKDGGTKLTWQELINSPDNPEFRTMTEKLSPEQLEIVKQHYESVNSLAEQKEFNARYKDSIDEVFYVKNNKLRGRPSKYQAQVDIFNKLTREQQEVVLRELDNESSTSAEVGGTTKLRQFYADRAWAEAWTDFVVKKFETDREGARRDIVDMLAQEKDKSGKLTKRGEALMDKLRAEGFLSRDGQLLQQRNLHNADMSVIDFSKIKGAVLERKADGKTHLYLNLNRFGDETLPHELFHAIFRESPMKNHFIDSLAGKLLGVRNAKGVLEKEPEVDIGQLKAFFRKYIDLTTYDDNGVFSKKEADDKFKAIVDALADYEKTGEFKTISDEARNLLESHIEEFGAYYFSHWLMGKNRNYLFYGGELKGIAGIVESVKEGWLDFWQSKISSKVPTLDFSQGVNNAFKRDGSFGRVSSLDLYMGDMIRANANSVRGAFNPDSLSRENAKQFYRSNGIRNIADPDGRPLTESQRKAASRRQGKEAYNILNGLDKNLRTSQSVLDENGKPVITGRLSEAELDALVKGGIVPRAWANKVQQGYAMMDGTIPNVISFGYLGKTEQIGDYSWPRKTGKNVAFKNRKALVFDVETKIHADGRFHSLFHTLDLSVIEQRSNHIWQNAEVQKLWNNDRGAMEADFFAYLSNASKASSDTSKLDSATLLEKGDGLGARRRDWLHQMAGMALQQGDAYKHQPIATIPEGIRHSVTTFNVDGMTTPRVENQRLTFDANNAHKFIRENWQPDDMRQEKTPSGTIMTHASGFKFVKDADGKVTSYTSGGAKIGTFGSIREAINAGKNEFHKVWDKHELDVAKVSFKKEKETRNFQMLEESERQEAIRNGDLFSLDKVRKFIGNRKVLRQTRQEFILDKVLDALDNPEQLETLVTQRLRENTKDFFEYKKFYQEIVDLNEEFKKAKESARAYGQLAREIYDKQSAGKAVTQEELQQAEIFAKASRDADWSSNVALHRLEAQKRKETDFIKDFRKRGTYDIFDLAHRFSYLSPKDFAELIRQELSNKFTKSIDRNAQPILQAKPKAYAQIAEWLFGKEFDEQMQTGVPIVVVGTHGTRNTQLMVSRLLLDDKLGTRYGTKAGGEAHSADLGHFTGGSQDTSLAYASEPDSSFRYGTDGIPMQHLIEFIGGGHWIDATSWQWSVLDSDPRNPANPAVETAIAIRDFRRKFKADLINVLKSAEEDYNYLLNNAEKLTYDEIQKATLSIGGKLSLLNKVNMLQGASHQYLVDKTARLGTSIISKEFDNIKNNPHLKNGFSDVTNNLDSYVSEPSLELYTVTIEDLTGNEISSFNNTLRDKLYGRVIRRVGDYSRTGKLGTLDIPAFKFDEEAYRKVVLSARKLIPLLTDTYNGWMGKTNFDEKIKTAIAGRKYVSEISSYAPKQQLRIMMAFDNPKVIIDPRGYDESKLAPQMYQAIKEGHDGIIFKRLSDGATYDDIYVQLKGNEDKILTIDTTFDVEQVPRKDEQGNTLRTGKDLGLAFQPDQDDGGKPIAKPLQIDINRAYGLFKREYEESTGQSWSFDKFQSRARNWEFYGDDNGYVAVRRQRSGFVKLVGMAGDNKSKLRGIQKLSQQGLPLWGMVSKEIKDIALKRGMREPNMIERAALKKAAGSGALGDAEILGFTSDNGVKLRYPDVGDVVKYMVGTPEYYAKLRGDAIDAVKNKIGFMPDENKGFVPKDEDKAPVNWIHIFGKEGYNMDVVWMKPSRFLNLAFPFLDDYKDKEGRPKIEALKKKMQSGSDMDRIHLTVDIKKGTKTFRVIGHEGRHRATAAMELFGDDKLIPVEIDYGIPHLKRINRGDYDFGVPEEKKLAGSISRKVKENKPMWNEKGTAKFMPDEYQGGDDYWKPKKNPFESRDEQGLLVRKYVIKGKDGVDEYNPDKDALTYIQIGHGSSPLGQYGYKNVEINGKQHRVNEVLYFINNDGKFISKKMTPENAKTHNQYAKDSSEVSMRMHPLGYKYADAIQGRVEMPIYEKGKLVRRGVASIIDFAKDKINSSSDVMDAKRKIAKELKINAEDFDLHLFQASDEVKAQRGYGSKDDLTIKFQPEDEGGRTYTKKQIKETFIGKIASQNPELTDRVSILYKGWDKEDAANEGRKAIILTRKSDGAEIGRIDFDYDHLTEYGMKGRGFEEIKGGGIVIDGINVKVREQFRGSGYQHILYSEMFERARAIGAKGFSQSIENKQGLPLKSVNRIIGESDNFIASLADSNPQRPTQENFDRLMAEAPSPTGNWVSNEPSVQNWGNIKKNAWYEPDDKKVGTQSSNVKLLLEGMQSGRILRTSSYKNLGLEDSLLIAHTPDTAKIGQVTAGDKALVDLQGGIFYAIANGKKIWASNFAGEGETNILVKYANEHLAVNKDGKAFIMLVKANNSKIFASVDGARGVSSILKHLVDTGVMSEVKYVDSLKKAAKNYLKLKGLDGLGKDELFKKVDDALLNSNANNISFEKRAKFSRNLAIRLKDSGAFDSEASRKRLQDSFHQGFERGFSKVEMERVFGNLMAEDIIKDVPDGHIYGAIEITSPLKETSESGHRGYNASIEQESGEPAKLIIFDKTAHATEVLNKKNRTKIKKSDPTRLLRDENKQLVYQRDEKGNLILGKKGKPKPVVEYKGEGSYKSYVGGNIPYQEVRGKPSMPFQPAEFSNFTTEQSANGRIMKNAKGYVIMLAGNKYRVYNPAKAIIGVYGNEEEAKRRVLRDAPKR